jgi:hypothetical protein
MVSGLCVSVAHEIYTQDKLCQALMDSGRFDAMNISSHNNQSIAYFRLVKAPSARIHHSVYHKLSGFVLCLLPK